MKDLSPTKRLNGELVVYSKCTFSYENIHTHTTASNYTRYLYSAQYPSDTLTSQNKSLCNKSLQTLFVF